MEIHSEQRPCMHAVCYVDILYIPFHHQYKWGKISLLKRLCQCSNILTENVFGYIFVVPPSLNSMCVAGMQDIPLHHI